MRGLAVPLIALGVLLALPALLTPYTQDLVVRIAIYAIFALKTRRNDVFNAVTSIFYFVFLFASAMFYPLDPLPRWLRGVAIVNPITWQIDWLRYTSIGLGDARRAILEGVAFVIFALCCFGYAAHALQQQE